MPTKTYTYSGTLNIKTCPVCGVTYGVDSVVDNINDRDGKSWYCTNGHSLHYTKPKAVREQERAEWAERDNARLRSQLDQAQAEVRHQAAKANGYKGQLVKTKKRAAAGVCPVPGCKRSFANVARHVERQHPGFLEHEEAHR